MLLATIGRIWTYALLVRVTPHADTEHSGGCVAAPASVSSAAASAASNAAGSGGGGSPHNNKGLGQRRHSWSGDEHRCTCARVWWRVVMCVISVASSTVFGMPTVWWMLSAANEPPDDHADTVPLCPQWTVDNSVVCAHVWLHGSTSLGETLLWGWTSLSLLLALGNLLQTCFIPELLPVPAYKRLAQLRLMADKPAPECLKEDRIRFDARVPRPFGLRLHSFLRVVMKVRRFCASAYTVLGIVSAADTNSRVFRWGRFGLTRLMQVLFYDALVYDTMMVIDDLGSRSQSHAIRELFKANRHRLYPTMPIAWRLSEQLWSGSSPCCCNSTVPRQPPCCPADEWPPVPSALIAAAAMPLRPERLSVAGLCSQRLRLSDLHADVDMSADGPLVTSAAPPSPFVPQQSLPLPVATVVTPFDGLNGAAPPPPQQVLTLNTSGNSSNCSSGGGGGGGVDVTTVSPFGTGPLPWPDWMRFQFGYPTLQQAATTAAAAVTVRAAAGATTTTAHAVSMLNIAAAATPPPADDIKS